MKFELGRIVATPGALSALQESGEEPLTYPCGTQSTSARMTKMVDDEKVESGVAEMGRPQGTLTRSVRKPS
jgi:hypothetical protein